MSKNDDLDRELDQVFPEPNPFAMTQRDLAAYYFASLDHAYRTLKGKRKHELKGTRGWKAFDSAGLHDVSAALGRCEAVEMLLPVLRELWHTDKSPEVGEAIAGLPSYQWLLRVLEEQGKPDQFRPRVRVLEDAAARDAEEEFRKEILAMAIATGEMDKVIEAADKEKAA